MTRKCLQPSFIELKLDITGTNVTRAPFAEIPKYLELAQKITLNPQTRTKTLKHSNKDAYRPGAKKANEIDRSELAGT